MILLVLFRKQFDLKRRNFIKNTILTGSALMTSLKSAYSHLNESQPTEKMPVLFIGHGNPMNAIENNYFSQGWEETGKKLPRPKAILSVSAHWVTPGSTRVTAMENPKIIYDFYGFPKQLYEMKYPASGSPEMAQETIRQSGNVHIYSDHDWGLDHGTWTVLIRMFPEAKIPVYQLSIDYRKSPAYHFSLAEDLKKLREKGVLIVGSGNMVHNLGALYPGTSKPVEWAEEFDNKITRLIEGGDFESVTNFLDLGELARKAHPSYEHFLPLIYSLGFTDKSEDFRFFNEGFDMGSISMKSILIG
jgi:4,5-DOPA dioxygenase extradiol